ELSSMVQRLGLRGKMELEPVISSVKQIIEGVRLNGDNAVREFTEKFDKVSLEADQFRVRESEIGQALDETDVELLDIMKQAAENIYSFHKAQLPENMRIETAGGGYTGLLYRALDIVG